MKFVSVLLTAVLCMGAHAALATQLTADYMTYGGQGSYSYNSSTNQYTIDSTGDPNFAGSTNPSYALTNFGTLAYTPISGNFDVSVQTVYEGGPSAYGLAGIMAMGSLNPSDVLASSLITVNYSTQDSIDVSSYESKSTQSSSTTTGVSWSRLTRDGNVFTSYYSTDGKSWTELQSLSIPMNTSLYVGLYDSAACSGACNLSTYGHIVTFANLSIGPYLSSTSGSGTSSAVPDPAATGLAIFALLLMLILSNRRNILKHQ